jgi:glyoxalase family protein
MTTQPIAGIHHVTALAGDPQANVDFYTRVLGLRLVKRTVNYDDPGTYHLYYGDEVGHPGTLLTFFPWPMARRGRPGAGQATVTSFAVPDGSLGFWSDRLDALGVASEGIRRRLDEEVLTLLDPDGLKLELVGSDAEPGTEPWREGPVPGEHAVRSFAGVTLTEWNPAVTANLLTGTLGFRQVAEEGERLCFATGAGGPAARVDLLAAPAAERGAISAGSVHHVAWRAADGAEQLAWRAHVEAAGLYVTPVLDRQYFTSIYFREPGGVLFEIATDPPGFTTDESVEALGTGLKLPPWLEPNRQSIEAQLPPLALPLSAGQPAGSAR